MIDRELNHPDEDERKQAADEVALLTPIVKAFLTDNAWIATSEALQVFGGHGYIAEWGMEQYVRDARINMIYEGTNTIPPRAAVRVMTSANVPPLSFGLCNRSP